MFSNSSQSTKNSITYPILDSSLSFADYITYCQNMIASRRTDLGKAGAHAQTIIEANSPFEFYPSHSLPNRSQLKYGILFVHGLFDCPFSLKEIATYLQADNVLCRAILLPGHGTRPADLLTATYQDWLQAVEYGVETLKKEVEQVFLLGYSTGAALSIYHALQDAAIKGVILLAPAIKIKTPVDIIFNCSPLMTWMRRKKQWLYCEEEVDYTKYLSIAFNPVYQVNQLIELMNDMLNNCQLHCPVFLTISREDETISSHTAIDFFTQLTNPQNKLLLYSANHEHYSDERIIIRTSQHFPRHIKHLSHVGMPFSPANSHYGIEGDYIYASHSDTDCIYGAYNLLEENAFNLLYKLNLVKTKRRQLTYNPDFDFMTKMITKFVLHEIGMN